MFQSKWSLRIQLFLLEDIEFLRKEKTINLLKNKFKKKASYINLRLQNGLPKLGNQFLSWHLIIIELSLVSVKYPVKQVILTKFPFFVNVVLYEVLLLYGKAGQLSEIYDLSIYNFSCFSCKAIDWYKQWDVFRFKTFRN